MAEKRTETITTSSVEYAITGNWTHLEVTNVDGAGYVTVAPEGTTAVSAADDMDVLPQAPGATMLIPVTPSQTKAFIASASTVVHIRGVAL